jgi:hypothetical protein
LRPSSRRSSTTWHPRRTPRFPPTARNASAPYASSSAAAANPVVLIVDEAPSMVPSRIDRLTLRGSSVRARPRTPGLTPHRRRGDRAARRAVAHPAANRAAPDLAFEHGFRCGEKPVTADVVETVLVRQLDDLEPRLTRHGSASRTWPTNSMPSPPRSGCSCAALWMRNARASSPSRCASPACHCKPCASFTDLEQTPSMSSTDQIIRAQCHLISADASALLLRSNDSSSRYKPQGFPARRT